MVTPIYAALLALLFLYLSFRTIGVRRALKVGIGDGGDKAGSRAMRVHANFAEYVPLILLLLLMLELQLAGGASLMLHVLGLALVVGRCSHAYGVSQPEEVLHFRRVGMVLTFLVVLITSLWNLVLAVF